MSEERKYYLVMCKKCGYTWYSRSVLLKPNCPSCQSRRTVRVKEVSISAKE